MRDRRIGLVAVGHALLDPAAHQAIGGRVDLDPLAAAVRQAGGRLQQQQALVGSGGEEPAAAAFLHQVLEVFGRLEAEQRQPEAVLAARLAVAAAAVAAVLGEDRRDLVGKVDRQVVTRFVTLTFMLPSMPGSGDDMNRRFAFGNRRDQPRGIDVHDAGRA